MKYLSPHVSLTIRPRTLAACVVAVAMIVASASASAGASSAAHSQRRPTTRTHEQGRRQARRHPRRTHRHRTQISKPHRSHAPARRAITGSSATVRTDATTASKATVSSKTTAASSAIAPQTAGAAATQLFAPTSVWNAPLSPTAAIDPGSDAMVSGLANEAASEYQKGTGPDIGTSGTTTVYQVGADQPTVTVQLSNPTAWWRVSLQSAYSAVPIPAAAVPAAGADAEMTIWQPSTDKLWEFFHMSKAADGWHADWGGAIQNVSQSPGYYTTSSWPGALTVWGATATSLPASAGVITLQDIQQGHIDHALALALPYPRAHVFTSPAQRTDGTGTDPNAIPEGAQLRLDPNLNLATLHLPPLTMMIAQAAQKYGMIVLDQTHWAIGLYAENPLPLGTNPYYTSAGTPSSTGPFAGNWPSTLMNSFPWRSLKVLKMSLRSS